MVSNVNEITYKYKVTGEKWGILRTGVLRKYLESVKMEGGVKFIGESYLWSQIAMDYDTVFVNEVLRTYYKNTEGSLCSMG